MAATIMNLSIYRKKLIDKIKEKNGSVSEQEGSKEDDTRLGNTTWYMGISTQSPADAIKKMLLY